MRRLSSGLLAAFALCLAMAAQAEAPALDWAGLPLPAIEGGELAPEALQGKVVLVVNTASFCGFTPQYEGLQALWERYRARGLVVLGVPSNDFGGQEPESEAKIKEFCETAFGIDFPMLAKQTVKGAGAHPLYRWAAEAGGPEALPRWNFHKYLIARDGRLAAWFPTVTKPESEQVTQAIEAALR